MTSPTRPRCLAAARWAGLPAALLILLSLRAHAATLTTRDGKTLEGAVTSAGPTTFKIDSPDHSYTIEIAKLRRVTFTDPVPATRPAEWHHQDLGKVHTPGSASESKGTFTFRASGWGIWGPSDGCHIVYWPLEGDGQIIAHVVTHGDERAGGIAGVMMRESLEPDANAAAAMVYPSGEVRFNRRVIEGYVDPPREAKVAAAYDWVRLARNGDKVTAYRSKTGVYWEPVASHKPVTLSGKLFVGLAAASTINTFAVPATIDHVRIIAGTPSRTFFDGAVGPATGIVMVDGTMLAGYTELFDKEKVRFFPTFDAAGQRMEKPKTEEERKAALKKYLTLTAAEVARIRLTPEPPELASTTHGQSGIFLVGGDYLEGEVERYAYGQWLDLNSVLFGTKRFEAQRDIICAVLRDVGSDAAPCEVRTRDGSILKAQSVSFDDDFITVETSSVGTRKFPLSELLGIEWRK